MPDSNRPKFRSFVTSGLLVPSVFVTGALGSDDVVWLMEVPTAGTEAWIRLKGRSLPKQSTFRRLLNAESSKFERRWLHDGSMFWLGRRATFPYELLLLGQPDKAARSA